MSVEQPRYAVLRSSAKREVRRYEARTVAETAVEGSQEKALSEAFSILAGYIFGGNVPAARIAMTAPVTQSREAQRIAMTAPVLQHKMSSGEAPKWVVQFTMPSRYALGDLPQPTDKRVRIREVPATTMAAIRFSGLARAETLAAKERELREFMADQGLNTLGAAVYAFYNAPFTLPPLRRNEVLIEVAPTE
ncbi:MAG: heme-binding protein [Candidatus Bipolaricaulota bacterium]